jgi:hypothetical protein
VAGDEDDGHVGTLRGHALLQFEAVEAGKGEIEQQAAGLMGAGAREKLLRGNEGFDGETLLGEKKLQGFADGDVIVDDEDNGRVAGGGRKAVVRKLQAGGTHGNPPGDGDGKSSSAGRQCGIQRSKESSIGEGLEETVYRTFLDEPGAQSLIAAGGDEDHGNVDSTTLQFTPELRAASPAHGHIEDHALRFQIGIGCEELLRRTENASGKSKLPEQIGEGFPYRLIVIDNSDKRGQFCHAAPNMTMAVKEGHPPRAPL